MAFVKRHLCGLIMTVVCVTMIVTSAYAGYTIARSGQTASEEATVTTSASDTLRRGANVTESLNYSACAHTVSYEHEADGEMEGLTFTQLQDKYPRYAFTGFSPTALEFSRTIDAYCPDHYILKYSGSTPVLYKTILGTDEREEIGRFVACELEYSADQALKTGKVFATEAQARAFMAENRKETAMEASR